MNTEDKSKLATSASANSANTLSPEAVSAKEYDIRHLRLRLGWSQAEMARRLSLEPVELMALEKNDLPLNGSLRGKLEMILRQADVLQDEQKKSSLSDHEA